MPALETPIGLLRWRGNLTERTLVTMPNGRQQRWYSIISHTQGEALTWLDDQQKKAVLIKAGRNVIAQALSLLDDQPQVGESEIAVPWPITSRPKIKDERWENSRLETVRIEDLHATQERLNVNRVRYYIKNPGAIEENRRAFANVYDDGGRLAIVDGHHRLAALWLLGASEALVWLLDEAA